ncbi:MAG: hypothetical protein HRF40_00615 [Nitrososphaera sp.]
MQKGPVLIVVVAASVAVASTVLLFSTSSGNLVNRTTTTNDITPSSTESSFQLKSSNTTSDGVVVTVEGLKTSYTSGEAVHFTVTARGNGIFCPKPIAEIAKSETGETIWLISGGAPCQQDHPQEIDKTWTMHDIRDEWIPRGPLFLDSAEYKLIVEYNGATITQDFVQE